MEGESMNASKSLIMIGGVLVVMLIISLGLYIYNVSNNADKVSETTTQMDIMANNKQYELYEGIRSGGEVKRLLNLAAQKNETLYKEQSTIKYCACIRTNVDEILKKFSNNTQMKIGLDGTRSYGVRYPSNIKEIADCISSSQKYKIWFSYNEYGYIWEIHIDKPDK